MQAILDDLASEPSNAEVVLCVSNKATAGAIGRARSASIATAVIDDRDYSDASLYEHDLLDLLAQHDVNFVVLAGYLRKVPSAVVSNFKDRILNIHPAMLPAFGGRGFYGRRVHEAVIEQGARWSGATVHLVDDQYDTGPIVLQKAVPVEQDDTPESLAARVLVVEHEIYPLAVRLFADGRIRVEGNRVIVE